jgi:hypothetical protein
MTRVNSVFAALLSSAVVLGCGGSNANQPAGDTAKSGSSGPTSTTPVDSCSLLSQAEIAQLTGNPVEKGQPFAGPEVCKWAAEPNRTSVLLTVRLAGSDREKVLCSELRKSDEGEHVEGVGDVAIWKFSSTMGLFNSGELETCGAKAYLNVSLNGKPAESQLKQTSIAIVRKVLQRL